jgi:hypothetical protein
VHDVTTSSTFWLTVAAIFAVNGLLSFAWDEPVLATAQTATAGLAALAAWAARRRKVVRGRPDTTGR